jgi:hypothetical protein
LMHIVSHSWLDRHYLAQGIGKSLWVITSILSLWLFSPV